jgi:hypothetical protein
VCDTERDEFINGQERAYLLEVLRLAETKKWVILNFRAKWENDPNAENLEGTEKNIWIKISNDTRDGQG